MSIGKKVWFVPDCYYPDISNGVYVSHEAICVLNTGDLDANIDITLYFEDREPMYNFKAKCSAKRCNHIRMDKLVSTDGLRIPLATPYAVVIKSDVDVIVQYSRLDTTQSEIGLATTMAYGE